ncbi:hypothetical protein [Paraburkholderia sp. A1RO-5L]|jgi:hypothetical protein|uniref:hypothetical protein n=1 Tax=Paraburkholderia sp. A1RO-5L TaxID=3028370 RepID=UPI003B797049
MRGRTERKQPVRAHEQRTQDKQPPVFSEAVARIMKALGVRNGDRTEQPKR